METERSNSDRDKSVQNVSLLKISSHVDKEPYEEDVHVKHRTNYVETLMHLFKGNVGPGIFAMGDAFKNSGIVLGSLLVPILGLVCLHCEHLLVNASNHVKRELNLHRNPDYATTAELCFAIGPSRFQHLAPYMKRNINAFLCLTQLGFCCVYFVFISSNIKQILDHYGFKYSIHLHMALILIPIVFCCVIRNLKYLAPLSIAANVCMLYGIAVTLYYACQKPFAEIHFVAQLEQLPLFFGTALYAFEGIGLVLPLQNGMKDPKHFDRPLGVLNVGIIAVIVFFSLIGIFSYLHYGEDVQGSVTVNLPQDHILAQSVKAIIPLGVLLTFALQFYIPIEIMFPAFQRRFGPFNKPVLAEITFRIVFVLVTFTLAEIIPFLHLFISLVGAFCSTSIALIFPPILEFVTNAKLTVWIVSKNLVIIGIGLVGCVTGSYESLRLIAKAFKEEQG